VEAPFGSGGVTDVTSCSFHPSIQIRADTLADEAVDARCCGTQSCHNQVPAHDEMSH